MSESKKIELFDSFEEIREKFGHYCDILSEDEISSWDKIDAKVKVLNQIFYIVKD